MKSLLKSAVRRSARSLGIEALWSETRRVSEAVGGLPLLLAAGGASKATQLQLLMHYRELVRSARPLPAFEDVELRFFSQNGEDGILLYLFALLGMGGRRSVEICAGSGRQCNTTNLIVNHGWDGLLFEGDPDQAESGRRFFATHPDTFNYPPRFVNAWITRENINELISGAGFRGEVDLLSLDIDGVDYWLWEAIDCITPRVVVAEVQAIWGAERATSVPYRPDFKAEYVNGFGVYSGASLPAFVALGRRKGYRLVGVQRYGYNAFFVREGLGEDVFPEVPADRCFGHPFAAWARRELLPLVADREWVDV